LTIVQLETQHVEATSVQHLLFEIVSVLFRMLLLQENVQPLHEELKCAIVEKKETQLNKTTLSPRLFLMEWD